MSEDGNRKGPDIASVDHHLLAAIEARGIKLLWGISEVTVTLFTTYSKREDDGWG